MDIGGSRLVCMSKKNMNTYIHTKNIYVCVYIYIYIYIYDWGMFRVDMNDLGFTIEKSIKNKENQWNFNVLADPLPPLGTLLKSFEKQSF